MSANKPTKAELKDIRDFLTRVKAEAEVLADRLDPKRKHDYVYGDPTGLLVIVDGLQKKAAFGLHLPAFDQLDKGHRGERGV